MAIKIPRGYTPLREALHIPDDPCEHCTQGLVYLSGGRKFPCVYCDATGYLHPDELRLNRANLAILLCKECNGNKVQDCEQCEDGGCKYCYDCGHTDCDHCHGRGYLFWDSKVKAMVTDVPKWIRIYANSLIDELLD